MLNLFRLADLTPAEHRDAIATLNRLSSRFNYAVIGATGALFVFHGIRFAARIWGLV